MHTLIWPLRVYAAQYNNLSSCTRCKLNGFILKQVQCLKICAVQPLLTLLLPQATVRAPPPLPIPRRENITSASEAVCTTLFFPTQTSACLSANYVSVIKPIKFHNLKYTKIDSEKDKNDMWCLLSLQSIWFGISLECLRGCQLELRLESRRLCRVEQRVSSKQLRRKLIWRATLFKM